MISVNLIGRLGNNLFQMAAALSLSAKNNTNSVRTNTFEYLNAFDLKDIPHSSSKATHTFSEKKFNFNEDFLTLPDGTHLSGYFQSYRYFENIQEKIKNNFAFKSFVNDNVVSNGYGYLNDNTNNITGIHVRRTDYLKIQHAHPICSLEYYETCLNKIGNHDHILVFSDDPTWCRNTFKHSNYKIIDLDLHCSLYMMTKVKNLVIANSSFSWWGAWLNNHPNKTIFAPKKWFGDTLPYRNADGSLENCIKDLFPNEWNKI
jgi:hypothetical protein